MLAIILASVPDEVMNLRKPTKNPNFGLSGSSGVMVYTRVYIISWLRMSDVEYNSYQKEEGQVNVCGSFNLGDEDRVVPGQAPRKIVINVP